MVHYVYYAFIAPTSLSIYGGMRHGFRADNQALTNSGSESIILDFASMRSLSGTVNNLNGQDFATDESSFDLGKVQNGIRLRGPISA